MNKKIVRFVIVILCYSVAIAGIFCFIGYKIAYDRIENSAPALISQTFYATISEIQNDIFTVTGMEVNDINFRGAFCFSLHKETKLVWRYTDISVEDLNVGDHIAVTFTGEILESYPGQIQGVDMIQLLDDEK